MPSFDVFDMKAFLRRIPFVRFLGRKIPYRMRLQLLRPQRAWEEAKNRLSYQQRYIRFDIKPGEQVLDIGSGGYPFPYATVLVDKYLGSTRHRYEPFVRDGKEVVEADIQQLPFPDKSFDFVYCSHVLEHVDDPIKACTEIMRVGKRGYIETPTFCKDILFSWARDMHRWHVVAIGRTLCFFEYSERQLDGVQSSAWRDSIFSRWDHPLQHLFYENQDLFNVMFPWSDSFAVYVFYLNGTVRILNADSNQAAFAQTP